VVVPILTGDKATDAQALMQWMMEAEQRLGSWDNDGSGYSKLPDFRGALVTLSAAQIGVNWTSPVNYAPFDAKVYDTDGIWSAASNTRLTVPAGVSKVRLRANVSMDNGTSGERLTAVIDKARVGFLGQPASFPTFLTNSARANLSSAVIPVTPGDYFEVRAVVQADTAVDVQQNQTWFAMEIVA
jgi:hypothetical protein